MKHFLLFTLFFSVFTISSFAQLDKKTWLTGGSASFYSYSQDYENLNSTQRSHFNDINLDANVGYFIMDKFSLGLQTSFRYYKGKSDDNLTTTWNPFIIFIGPNIRYYLLNSQKQFNIVTDLSYQFGIYNDIGNLPNSEGNGNSLSAMTGTEVFFNHTAGLELLFGYKRTYSEEKYSNGNFNINKRGGLFMTIGFKLHLVKK